jgi:hypothetical protein
MGIFFNFFPPSVFGRLKTVARFFQIAFHSFFKKYAHSNRDKRQYFIC